MPETMTPAQQRAAIARASRRAGRTGDPADRVEVDRLRAIYTSDQLAAHIESVVAKAPPLTDAQRGRLTALLSPGVSP